MEHITRGNQVFHITVGTTPETHGEVTLQSELRLLKAALLYADAVKFCSVSSSFLITLLHIGKLSGEELLQISAQGMNNAELDAALKKYRELKRKKHPQGKEFIALKTVKAYLDRAEKDTRQYFEDLLLKAGLNHLEAACNTGIVEIRIFEGADSAAITQQYFDAVSDAILSGETYPLFDDLTGEIVSSAIREGKIVPSNVSLNRAKQIGLSSDLLRRLPLFDDAPVDEILDIRKALDKPLIRFRSAIIQFSREVHSTSWDKDFPKEAEQVFREHVEPTVLEIEEACKSNRILLRLIPDLIEKPLIPASLAILIGQANQLPEIVADGLGLVAGASVTALRSVREWRERNREIEGNQLYFYYKAGKMLSD